MNIATKTSRILIRLVQFNIRWLLPDLFRCSSPRWYSPSTRASRASSTTSSKKHATHHIQQWIGLSWNLNAKILFANMRQCIVPDTNCLNGCCITRCKQSEKIRTSALDRKKQHVQEIQQWYSREDSYIRAGTAHILRAERRVRGQP